MAGLGDSFSRGQSAAASFNKVPVDIYRLESACATHSKGTKEDVVPVLVEVPRGTPNKYELEKDWGLLALDRVLHSSVFYPGDYGFVPNTLCGDGDPIDVLILSNYALTPGVVADARIVGVMDMEDEKGQDQKLIAVVEKDPRSKTIQDLSDLPNHAMKEIEHFFANYKGLENKKGAKKWAKVKGFYGKERAMQDLRESYVLYEQHQNAQKEKDEAQGKKITEVVEEHFVDYHHAPRDLFGVTRAGAAPRYDRFPEIVQAYIECPKGANNKYEFDENTGCNKLDRVLHSAVFYPYDYGFVPSTLCGDGDPLDILVLSTFSLAPGTFVDARVIGVLDMADEKGEDAKLLAVVDADPRFDEISDLSDIQEHVKIEIQHFFETYKSLEKNKWSKVMGWRDKREAIKEVSESAATYDREAAKEFLNVPKLYHLEIGVDSPAIVNAIVECPKGSSNKYKFCKEVGQLKLDRVFHSSAFYPGNYGFIPQTLGSDGNPMDCLILSGYPLHFGCAVSVRPVAMMNVVDERGPDTKIIAVPVKEPRLAEIQDLEDIPAHVKEEIHNFFIHYKDLEDTTSFTRVTGWSGREEALATVHRGNEWFYLFGQRMDDAEAKVYALEQDKAHMRKEMSTMQATCAELKTKMEALEAKLSK
jgi:inorganic pyrophosphatase